MTFPAERSQINVGFVSKIAISHVMDLQAAGPSTDLTTMSCPLERTLPASLPGR